MRKLLLAILSLAALMGGVLASEIKGLVPFVNGADLGTIFVSAGSRGAFNLPIPMGKTLAAWAAGSGGGLDIAGSIPAGAGGHVFVICCDPSTGQTDALLSASAYNPAMPAGFTKKQIVNSFLTDASDNIVRGQWRDDGSFDLSIGATPVLNESLSFLHLVPAGVPRGTKVQAKMRAIGFNSETQNWGFYGLVTDPDSYPTSRLGPADYAGTAATATYDKVAGQNSSAIVSIFSDEMGQVFDGSLSGTSNNLGHLYLQGWWHPRVTDQPTVSIGILGASLTMDRNANNWPNMMAARLQAGKTSRVRMLLAGKEGTASNYWISNGWHTALARTRPHLVILDMTADANAGQGITVAQSLANTYAMVDAIRTGNPDVPIFLFKANHMRSDATGLANVLAYYANYDIVAANRPNIHILDTYTPWGDPALHPEEYATSDPIHPLYPGNLRVTIPAAVAAIAPYVN